MNTVPTSFNFGQAIEPDYVVKCSYGNDSIALIQFLHEWNQKHPLGKVVVLYNDTGWAASWWPARVENGEQLARACGFIPFRTTSIPWKALLLKQAGWPDLMRRHCTKFLKIIPTLAWLSEHDPEGRAEMVCGVRREESAARANWPEHVESDRSGDGRPQWSPLVLHTAAMRDELIIRAGWKPLPHRSRECRCVLANAQDLVTWSEEDIAEIEGLEAWLESLYPGKKKLMFNPNKKVGNPVGIRAVVEWAKAAVAKKTKDDSALEPTGCDSGYCSE